jgi:hypothetical protein
MEGTDAILAEDELPDGATHGWETPPEGLNLTFSINTRALHNLPETAPFPERGDLRWRPANRAFMAGGDTYTPLATLVDADGNQYGDGIAWVEHRFSEPKGGRVLYIWMRMPDALGADDLFCDLFDLLGRRLRLNRELEH